MADWEIALDKQLASFLFYTSEKGIKYLTGYLDDVEKKHPQDAAEGITRRMLRALPTLLWQADPIYVTPQMMNLLEYAWPSYQPEPLWPEDLIVEAGFVYLPRPIYTTDVNGMQMVHRAVGWAPVSSPKGKGILITTFADAGDEDEYTNPVDAPARQSFFGYAMSLGFISVEWFGQDPLTMDRIELADYQDREQAERAVRQSEGFLGALLRLLSQRIGVGYQMRPSRALRKREQRTTWQPKYITVVTLRRPKTPLGPDHEQHPVDWSHRWVVSGHWRWQPYRDGVKQIWIAPYVKGPEDKPLVIRGARVFRLSR